MQMSDLVANELPETLLAKLQKEHYVLLATVDVETKAPSVHAVSWVFAPNPNQIRFAVGQRSRIVENIEANPDVSITLIGAGSTYAIEGKARVVEKPMANVQIKLAKVKVDVTAVRDVMFYGAKIDQEPTYVKTYDEDAAAKLDNQVMSALKKDGMA
jgi:nitroimidazol reductase NimA-like FMN-containing flavoprotein (pyridoxamine 5'-phosphate oxidase superfamily)